ncbi:hypothetical protein EI546_14025 [Aequorivita sp. H23M31]|uniref:DUF3078 domain-containing protein n=1 Tax=Aequorivita ciconiae TaxID=2494375 RepID=A0A410G664_9FLAO|nr:DUF6588 family protein [Aequorivita sp. H23M31]QAA82766.1 hypothetical protein EI546_14025 [Aequorivita sp. H23M31]
MKKLLFVLVLMSGVSTVAQENLEDLIAAGIEDAQRFATGYISPGAEGMIHIMANGWVQTAETKKPLRFDISIVGNAGFIKKKHQTFTVNTADYNNLKFRDGSTVKEVATTFGENDPDVFVYSVVRNGEDSEEVEFKLPQGLASVNLNILPTAFLQARLGIFKGTEVKLRYFPKIAQEEVKVGLFGAGLQHDFTSWIPAEKVFPVAISGVVAFTNVGASYNFTNHEIVSGENQHFDLKLNSWLFQLQASTKMRVFNVYGGVGYVSGTSDFNVLGNYKVNAGIPLDEMTNQFKDPFTVKTKVSDMRATLGANLRLGFFGLNLDYNLAEFNSATVGLHFGI